MPRHARHTGGANLALLTAAILIGIGCSGGGEGTADSGGGEGVPASRGAAIDVERRIIRYNLQDEPKEMDPQKAEDTIAFRILAHVMEGLMRLDPENKPFPATAENVETISPTEYVFTIRSDAKWSDGEPVTAHDFEFAWKRAVDPKTASTYAWIMNSVLNARKITAGEMPPDELGVKAEDSRTLRVHLERPTAYFLNLTAFGTYFPARRDFVESVGESYGADADKLLYNGPFVIAEWKHNASLRQVKNEHYWNRDEIFLNEIDMPYLIRDDNTIYNMFKDGQYAITDTISKEMLPDAQENGLTIERYNYGSVWYLEFNTLREVTGNKNLRKAIQYALDRQEFCDQVVGIPGTKPAIGIVPEYMPGVVTTYGEEYPHEWKEGDLDTARRYLALAKEELGVETIPPLNVLASDADTTKRDMEYMQGYLKETLGIELVLDFQTFKVRLERTNRRDFDIVNAGWGPDYLDVMTFADLNASWNEQNNSGWASAEYDALIETAMNESDPKTRLDAVFAAEKILIEDAPVVPYFHSYRVYVIDPRLRGVLRRTVAPDPDFYYARIINP